jgi:glutaminyl-peptide cyclotransferase
MGACQDEVMPESAHATTRHRTRVLRLLVVAAPLLLGAALGLAVLRGDRDPGGAGDARQPPAPATATHDAFDSGRAWADLRRQVRLGSRPAGSAASRRLARWARAELPRGRIERVSGGLANVVGTVPGSRPAVVVGAHYDTKAMRGFVGANDGASATAVVLELARALERSERPSGAPELRFVLFDGEESPDDSAPFYSSGLRGSRAYAAAHAGGIRAVVVVDMVGDRDLSIPREGSSDERLWARLRRAAREAGTLSAFPDETGATLLDDHTPFLRAGIPAIDVIDFEFACWHETCDDMSAVSQTSLETVGETLVRMLERWR